MKFDFSKIHASWEKFILDKKTSEKLKTIEKALTNKIFYPDKENVFRFMNNNLNNIKYIIVGMDPYPQSYKDNGVNFPVATGRAFEPANYETWIEPTHNTSITNILKAIYRHETNTKDSINIIREKIKNKEFNILPPHEFFDNLEKQGVLLLNYGLTVEPNKPGSHIDLWSKYSKELIKYIDNNSNATWVLLGKNAQSLKPYITKNEIIEDKHPATGQFHTKNESLQKINIDFTGYKKRH